MTAIPPSWVVVKRENSPGSWLRMRMSALGVRLAPSRMTMDESVSMALSRYSCMKAAGTRGPFWMKFFTPMS